MGTWQLEVFRMAIYVGFPVGCFWIFNQPWVYQNAFSHDFYRKIKPQTDPKMTEAWKEVSRQLDDRHGIDFEQQLRDLEGSLPK